MYLIVAIVLILCAFGVVARHHFSAGGSASLPERWLSISAIWWMPSYPVWSLAYIFVGILVIYGLAVYGGREVTT